MAEISEGEECFVSKSRGISLKAKFKEDLGYCLGGSLGVLLGDRGGVV